MEEEVKAALQNDSVAQVQALEVKFNRALKEAAEEDYLHECAILEEVGGFKRQIFGDAAHLGAQKVVKWARRHCWAAPKHLQGPDSR